MQADSVLEPAMVTIAEAARILGMGTSTAYDLVRKGKWPESIRTVKIGGQIRVNLCDLRAFTGPTPTAPGDDEGTD